MLLLNYKPVLSQPTGIGVYANSILPAFEALDHVLIPGGGCGGGRERLKRLAWSQFQLPRLARQCNADLIFTPAPEGYLGTQRVPQIVMVHDLRPLTHPERSMQSLYFRNWVPQFLRQCSHILTNSNFTASEVCRTIGVAEGKVSVTSLGYDSEHFYPADRITPLHVRPYLLHVGQAYPHKNLRKLIHAFSSIASKFTDLDLILIGKPHPTETPKLCRLVSELGLTDKVFFKSYVAYSDLPNWYRGARLFVYPSLWEGFGLPILEAMACGAPVITSASTGMIDAAGQAAYLLQDPTNTDELIFAIKDLLTSPAKCSRLQALGANRVQNASWDKTNRQTRDLIKNVLNRSL